MTEWEWEDRLEEYYEEPSYTCGNGITMVIETDKHGFSRPSCGYNEQWDWNDYEWVEVNCYRHCLKQMKKYYAS